MEKKLRITVQKPISEWWFKYLIPKGFVVLTWVLIFALKTLSQWARSLFSWRFWSFLTRWTYLCRCIQIILQLHYPHNLINFAFHNQHNIILFCLEYFISLFSVILTSLLLLLWFFSFNRDLATAWNHTFSAV